MDDRAPRVRRALLATIAASLLIAGALLAVQAHALGLTSAATNRDAAYTQASITGTVKDASGNLITSKDICVMAYSADDGDYGSATTDANGNYVITGLVPGSYYVEAQDCSGSTRNDTLTTYGGSSPTEVTVTDGQTENAVDIDMAAGASISGQVTDATGHPITSADICISAWANDSSGYGETTSTASGRYTITQLPAGTYSLYASDCDGSQRNDLPTYYGQSTQDPYGTSFALAAGQSLTGDDIQMQSATSVSGHVYGGSGTSTPLSGACVAVRDASRGEQWNTRSGADGSYTVAQLQPGDGFTVEFTPCSAAPNWGQSYYAGAATAAGATTVTPTAEAPATGIDAHLPAPGAISGRITDAAGKAITSQDVCISAGLVGGNFTRYSQTDASGGYTVAGLGPGTYDVKAYDCRTSSRDDLPTYYATSGGKSPTPVSVTSGATTSGIDVQIAGGTSISGHVYGGAGTATPLADACVDVYNPATSRYVANTTTGSDGAYALHRLAAGVGYKIWFAPCGVDGNYVNQWYDGADSESAATTITPTAAAPSTGIDAHLSPGGTITGTITDANGNPITTNGVCVQATPVDGGEGYGDGQTGPDGTYSITGLAPGSYDISASDCDGSGNDVPTSYSTGGQGGTPTAVPVTGGQTVSAINIQMGAATSISGHVYAGSGTTSPLQDVCVTAYQAGGSGDWAGYATTRSDGSYQLTGLSPNVGYKVEFDPCGGSSDTVYATQYYNDQSSLQAADVVTPSATNPSTGIDAHLSGGASISGTVSDSDGNPITTGDICVSAMPAGGGIGRSATTGANGQYDITGLGAGSYYVEFADCSSSTRNDVAQWYGDASDQSGSSLVVLSSDGSQTGVDATLQTGTSISGHAYAGAGTSPLAQVCVSAYPAAPGETGNDSSYNFHATTGSDGSYTLNHVAPVSGGYTVQFTDCNTPITYVWQYYGGSYDWSTAQPVAPTTAAPATGIDAHLVKGGAISGTVTDANGPVTSGVCVDATLSGGSSYYSGFGYNLSSSGGYTIGGLPTGSYSVSFSDCGARNDVDQTLANTVSVTQGQVTSGVNVTMAPATSISGHVYGGAGTTQPLQGVCVYAGTSTNAYAADATTSADGSYVLQHLAPGTSYTVEFNGCYGGAGAAYGTQYYNGVASLDQAAVLTPTLDSPATGIDAHLPSGAPVTTITGGPANQAQTSQTTASFSFVANQSGATFDCALDGGAYTPCASPYEADSLSSGSHTFSVRATVNGVTETSPQYVQWTVNPSAPTSTSQGQVTAGGTFNSDPGQTTSSTNPVIVAVTPPASSQVTMTTEPTTTPSGNGYTVFGQQMDIAVEQPGGTGTVTGTAADPLRIVFTLDKSQVPAQTPVSAITVTRNGAPAADCAAQDGSASPDPCIASRTTLGSGDVQITVLTTHASTWNFAAMAAVDPPSITSAPGAPTGTAQQGQTLTAVNGSWSNSPTSFSYQWEDCDASGASCAAISGATGKTYSLVAADVGHTIRVLVTAHNAGGTSQAQPSAQTVQVVPPVPSNTAAPGAPTGTAQQGQTLTAVNGSWSNSPTSFSYQWEDCDAGGASCATISGATGRMYSLVASDVGHTIRVLVTAHNAGGASQAQPSAQTGKVASASSTGSSTPGSGGGTPPSSDSGTGTPPSSGSGTGAPPSSGSGTGTPPSSGSKAPPAARATAAHVTVSGTTARVTVACAGRAGQKCRATLSLTIVETLKGTKVVGITAARTKRKTVTLGTAKATIAAGRRSTIKLALNAKGRQLLASTKRLKVQLSLVTGGSSHAVKTLTFTAPKKPAHRGH